MESCLLNYFVLNDELKSVCDFNPYIFEPFSPVYEVIRIEKSVPIFLEDHIKRFYDSCDIAGIAVPIKPQQIKKRIKALIDSNRMKTGLIKFLFFVHPQIGNLFSAWVAPFFFPSETQYQQGVRVKTFRGERENPHAKFANLSVRQQADNFIKNNKIYEVILINSKNLITEGSRSNLFFVKNNCNILFTPHEKLVLKGITRQKIIQLAVDNGLDVFESEFIKEELFEFNGVFLTGTSPKVLPVNSIDEQQFDVKNHIISFLQEKYSELIEKYIRSFSW